MIKIQYLASQLWSGFLMIKISFDLKALCRPLYALFCFFVECVVCFCYLYYIIIMMMMMMIISVWQRSFFHWYILLSIKLWNLLLFCYGWICRVGLHDNLLCCWVINVFFFFFFSPHLQPRSVSLSGFVQKAFSNHNFPCKIVLHLWFLNILNCQSLLF